MSMFDKARKAAADTLTEDIKMIDVDNLHESPDNYFEIDRIPELAETVLGQGGVMQNLIVTPLNGMEYEIISGHRRVFAVRYLLEQGESVSRYLPCLIQEYENAEEKRLNIALMNVSSRVLTDAQLFKSYEILNDTLQRKKQLGEKFGRVRDKLAEILGVSSAQVQNLQTIDKKAIPEVKEALENGVLSVNTAKDISKLDTKEQKKIVDEKPLSKVKPKDVKGKTKPSDKSKTNEDLPDNKKSDKFITFSENGENEETDNSLEDVPHYKEWGVFDKAAEMGLTFYKYDLPDNSRLIVMEFMQKSGDEWELATRKYIQKHEHFTPDEVNDYEVESYLRVFGLRLCG